MWQKWELRTRSGIRDTSTSKKWYFIELQGVHLILCFFWRFSSITDLSLFSLGVSVCTHTRQVEHQRCSRTGRVKKNHNILRKSTIFDEHPVYDFLYRNIASSRCNQFYLLSVCVSCADLRHISKYPKMNIKNLSELMINHLFFSFFFWEIFGMLSNIYCQNHSSNCFLAFSLFVLSVLFPWDP